MRIIRKIMILFLVAVMCVSGFLMAKRSITLKKEEMEYANIQKGMREAAASVTEEAAKNLGGLAAAQETEQEAEGQAYEAPQELLDLMAEYPDCIGWIDIEDTNIHYPIMQNEDNEYYLHRNIDGENSVSGSIYLDSEHDINAKGLHTIYGHHMKNGTMFKDIARFADASFMEVHQKIQIMTADREINLRPVYCYAEKADGTYRQVLRTHGQVIQFIMDHTGQEIDTDDLYVLVTCSYGGTDERMYLYCVPDKE